MKVIEVGSLRHQRDGTLSRVTATVDGVPVWFETRDLVLRPAPEAMASAFLIPAAARGAGLALADPLDPVWRRNADRLLDRARHLWRWRGAPPRAPAPPDGASARTRASASGLFFSGGVDSFHALLRSGEPVDLLVTVAGFDFPAADRDRAAAVERMTREVAAARGARAVFVRTDLREHPLLGTAGWLRAFGGAMAAVAHLLGDHAGRMLFADSTTDPGTPDRSGSGPAFDPAWSSTAVETAGVGQGIRRIDKLRAIAADPLVRRHLRVCWKNAGAAWNCSRCNKCVLAMLILAEAGLFDGHPFEGMADLAARLDALKRTPDRIESFAELGGSPRLDPDVAAAVGRFVRRSRHEVGRPVRWRRRLIAALLGVFGAGGRATRDAAPRDVVHSAPPGRGPASHGSTEET